MDDKMHNLGEKLTGKLGGIAQDVKEKAEEGVSKTLDDAKNKAKDEAKNIAQDVKGFAEKHLKKDKD